MSDKNRDRFGHPSVMRRLLCVAILRRYHIEDQRGKPVLPPSGLDDLDKDQIQKEIRGQCRRLDPEYQPILSPETYMDRQILVVWTPGGDVRPYQAPKRGGKGADWAYFVRIGSETVEAKGEVLTQLLQLTARVPYDDRRRSDSSPDDISGSLVRKFLADINSDLVAPGANLSTCDLLRSLRLTAKTNSSEVPRNVALLFFSENPEQYFPGTRIEVVQFGDDAGGDLVEEKTFRVLRRTIQLADNDTRAAWAWFDLARTLSWLKAPESEIRGACEKAIELEPEEKRFKDWISDRFSPKGR